MNKPDALKRETSRERDALTGLLKEQPFCKSVQSLLPSLRGQWCMVEADIEHCRLFQEWNGEANTRNLFVRMGQILDGIAKERGGLAGHRGHDEFILLIPYEEELINTVYEQLRDAIEEVSNTVGFHPVLGVCLIKEGDKAPQLVNHAGLAAENGKGSGGKHIHLYNAPEADLLTEEFTLLSDFSRAIRCGEISFYVQPQCRISTGRVVGGEALARWRRADGTFISPTVFVPILEKYGLIPNLDQFIWESVCSWLRDLIDRGIRPVPISVNVSRVDLSVLDVPSFIFELQKKYRLPEGLLKIEVTETAMAEDAEAVRDAISRLHEMGFFVLMDDFGSGASSLNMLRSLNLDVIKLDAQFLRIKEEEQRKGISIVEAVVNLTKNLALPSIVEGVETSEQVQFLGDLGCRYMQGFYFYQPLEPKAFEELISEELRVDRRGLLFKSNQQVHVREFLDESIYSDAMLNNILGPVAFYRWGASGVDIIRYNQQFYKLVGLESDVLTPRLKGIEAYFHPEDVSVFYDLMREAEKHRVNGASGLVRVYKPNGVIMWMLVQLYYLREDENGKIFYGSDRDVTEQQFINLDLPGAYYRCRAEAPFEFLYISQSFEQLSGYTAAEIETRFDNRLLFMIHPGDRSQVMADSAERMADGLEEIRPYRLRRKRGDYIHVTDRSILSDRFGVLCWQSVSIDITKEMELRRRMDLLSAYLTNSVVLVMRTEQGFAYDVVVNGLGKRIDLDAEALSNALGDGSFFTWIKEGKAGAIAARALQDGQTDKPQVQEQILQALDGTYMVEINGQRPILLHMRADGISGEKEEAAFILILSA